MRQPKADNIKFHADGWDQLLVGVIQAWALPKAEAIADACNASVKKMAEAVLAEEDPIVEDNYRYKADARRAEINRDKVRSRKARAHEEPPEGKRDYMVSAEGSDPLSLRDYRATVITVTNRAKLDNARNQSLIRNLHLGGGT